MKTKEQITVLICNNCKVFHIAPKQKCDCGCTTLTKTHPSNLILTKDFTEGCDKYFGGKKK